MTREDRARADHLRCEKFGAPPVAPYERCPRRGEHWERSAAIPSLEPRVPASKESP